MADLTYERAEELLRYDADTGRIVWRVSRGGARAGDEAGGVSKSGRTRYRRIMIDGKKYQAHRVVWLLHRGEWPNAEIDHRDGDGLKNRMDNLHDVDGSTNLRNSRMHSNNASGVNGVSWSRWHGKWWVQIQLHGKKKHLGFFNTIEEATARRAKANVKHGFTERHGH